MNVLGVTEGRDMANMFGCQFLETSAKAPTNVEQAFFTLVKEIRKYNQVRVSNHLFSNLHLASKIE
jgi:hypothetical protein